MKKMSKRVIFFGNERIATGVATEVPTLQALIAAGYDICAVVSNFEAGVSRSEQSLEVAELAKKYNIRVLLPKKLADIKDQLAAYKADVGVLVAYGRIVPDPIINLFAHGIINIHPSLLPKHRGPTPIEGAILQGDAITGVSLMKLVSAMDAGPIYGQAQILLTGKETKQALADRLLDIGKTMLIELLPDILLGDIVAMPQNDSQASYDKLIAKSDGFIDWKKPAKQLEREVRAFSGWPKSRALLGNKDVIITKAYAESTESPGREPGDLIAGKQAGVIVVACGSGYLCIEQLKPAGKKEMTAAAFLAGYGHLLRNR